MVDLESRARTVALFRAREDAAPTAARLRALGFRVRVVPATETVALAPAGPAPRVDAILATSAKAFLGGWPCGTSSLLYVVGARTAKAAARRGLRLAAPPAPDARRLVETVAARLAPDARLLYLAGRDRKPTIEAELAPRFDVVVAEVYAAEARASFTAAEARRLAECGLALHYSRRSASLAALLAEAAGLGGAFRAMRHLCLSEEVAAPLRALGADDVTTAASPDEAALIAALGPRSARFPSGNPSPI